jgi:hypothetical protein
MKAKDYIIIGGAVALYFLWKNKNKKDSTSSTTEGTTTTGGASNEPQQVFGLGLPENMDLPVLTAGTGIPTEVAIQQGGVMTQPRPAIIQQAILGTEEALISSGVRPIPRPTEPSNVEPIIIVPRTEPTPYLADN